MSQTSQSNQPTPKKQYQDKITPEKYRAPEVKEPTTTDDEERIVSNENSSEEEGSKSIRSPHNTVTPEAPASGAV